MTQMLAKLDTTDCEHFDEGSDNVRTMPVSNKLKEHIFIDFTKNSLRRYNSAKK